MDLSLLDRRGWMILPARPATRLWAAAAHRCGRQVVEDPEMRDAWLHCEGTWFVGVDALPNGPDGSVDNVPLAGDAAACLAGLGPLHRAQLSVTYPGYPRPRRGESPAAFRFRQRRHAAHVDGITPEGPDRRRVVTEPHALILGLPLTETAPGACPLMVWEGSHHVIGAALRAAFDGVPAAQRAGLDVTDPYQAARRHCFETCAETALHARPGEALLLHRHLLHGIGPWQDGAAAPPEGRMIAYFRPLHPEGLDGWLAPGL